MRGINFPDKAVCQWRRFEGISAKIQRLPEAQRLLKMSYSFCFFFFKIIYQLRKKVFRNSFLLAFFFRHHTHFLLPEMINF